MVRSAPFNLETNMAHEIDMTTGKAAIAFVGATPWHGLGQRIDAKASIESWQKAAGMDWTIMQSDVWFAPHGSDVAIPAGLPRQVLYRSDTKAPLSVVGDRYNIVQPHDVLEFFRDLTETGGFEMHTAGVLFGGQKLWALASIGKNAAIAKTDKIGGYLLLTTSCDGTMATTAKFTSIRVVCNNTLSMAVPRGDKASATENVKVPHSAKFDHEAVKRELGLGAAAWDAFIQQARALAKVKLDDAKALHVLREGWADAVDSEVAEMDFGKFGALPTIERIMKLFKGGAAGSDMDSAAGTAWGLVNAVTEFYDHHARAKLTDNRLESAWFGKGNFVKTCLFEQALELV